MIENFKIIKEIDSLDRNIKTFIDLIENQNKRILSINNKINDKNEKIDKLNKELKSISSELTSSENELSSTQQKLEIKVSQKGQVFTDSQIQALDKEIKLYEEKIDSLEETVFSFMEKKESIEENIKDSHTFIKGASNSLIEIQKEVDIEIEQLTKKKTNTQLRVDTLLKQLPEGYQSKIKGMLDKDFRSTIVATIVDRSCNYCRASLPTQFISDVEDKHILKTCSACKRVFIPSSSSY